MDIMVHLIKENELFNGDDFNIVEREYSLPHNKNIKKDVIISKAISSVVPVLDEKHIILVNQYRFGVKENLLELPAGTVNMNEDPLICAKREIEEETGYKAKHWIKYNAFFSSPGLNNELVHCFEANKLIKTDINLDYDEILTPEIIEKENINDLLVNGYIKDAKTIIGLLFFLKKNK